jgi:hypothetical protein
LFKLVLDTVWWRRVVYFVSLFFVMTAAAFPLLAQYLRWDGVTDHVNDISGGPVGWTFGLIDSFLPGIAEPWLTAVTRNSSGAALILAGVLASVGLSGLLQRRIRDRSRAAWNVRPRFGGIHVDHLAPEGQRHALAKAAFFFVVFAIGAGAISETRWLTYLFAGAAIVFGLWWAYRRWRPAASMDPVAPNAALWVARKLRTSDPALRAYRFMAQKAAPAAFLAASILLVTSLAHRAVFDLLSAGGEYCHATKEVRNEADKARQAQRGQDQSAQTLEASRLAEKLDAKLQFRTDSMCHATNLRLVAGRKYRIRLDMDDGIEGDWFDKDRHTDVAGFAADDRWHFLASPLKRWWRENWFQPIARIGETGNYEHVLQPADPLPLFRPNSECRAANDKREPEWTDNVASPAPAEFRAAQVECDDHLNVRPSRVLISDITADATGELFLYVNDAVLTWPGRTKMFYSNNRGTAKVTVTRILAPTIIDPKAEVAGR